MNDTTTEADTCLTWTDQVTSIARFIADHDLHVITLSAHEYADQHQDGAHVQAHVASSEWTAWTEAIAACDVVTTHDEPYTDGRTIFHYVVAIIAGVRVQLCYLTDIDQQSAVA